MNAQLRVYCRTLGAIQCCYAMFFGWLAWVDLTSVIQTPGTFKGVYFPAVDVSDLCYGTMSALVAIAAVTGGCGLIYLRRWVRIWQIAYVMLLFILFAAVTFTEVQRGHPIGYVAFFAGIFALPYLPFFWISPSRKLNQSPKLD